MDTTKKRNKCSRSAEEQSSSEQQRIQEQRANLDLHGIYPSRTAAVVPARMDGPHLCAVTRLSLHPVNSSHAAVPSALPVHPIPTTPCLETMPFPEVDDGDSASRLAPTAP
uniref:Uncharacterized protein n=1 Tax=Oryza sativa subsp. japonica TaxID=39947 RepID=Q6K2G3_ORYSJ|nr:hypothetical protein [Oryza sativa Japonica Group]